MQPKPTLNEAPNSPFLPYFIGYKGNSIQAAQQINGVKAAQKLAHQIASELQTPNALSGQHTLTTFNIMTRVIRTMNVQQIKEAGNQLYFPKNKADPDSKSDAQKYLAWVAFRDAVAESGTGPALVTLKDWIQDRKVRNETAAQLISVLPETARYPTQEYMRALFELATSPEVTKQQYMNSTSLLAFTNLIRKVQVNNETTHNWFPVHSFGRPIDKKAQQAIITEYIPYLAKQLNNSVKAGDSHKIQVYIRALGNTAHPKILSVFEPFLEGKQNMSDFQRLVIVASMDYMTNIYPKLARSVLYKIYKNTADAPEVRVAAVMQLMKTNPPAQMLQRMAQYTHSDPSPDVNAAVKSSIESATKLKQPRHQELASNAKAAVNLLTPKQYGYQYSKNYLRSYINEQQKLGYKVSFTSIQSEDSYIPSSLFYTLRKNLGGYTRQRHHLAFMSSSADDIMNLLSDQFGEYETQSNKQSNSRRHQRSSSNSGSSWTTDKIANMLNIEVDDADQVEGNVMISWAGARRFFAFDNHTIEQLPSLVKDAAAALREGENFNYTKMYNQYSVKIGFPTTMGLPFIYTLQVPSLMSIGGEAQLKTHPELSRGSNDEIQPPQTLNLTADIQMTYASKTQSKLGFVTPFNHQRYLAGYDSNTQIHVPLRAKIDVDVENNKVWAKLQPLHPNKYQKIAEYSTMAYTGKHDILDLSPPQLSDDTEITHVRPVQRFQTTAGHQNTGFAFDLQAETEQKHFDTAYFMNGAQNYDLLSAILHYNPGQTIKPNTNYTLAYNPNKSTAKSAKISLTYANDEESEAGSEHQQNGAITSTSDSQKRVRELLKNAGAGIKDSYAQVVDMAVEFNGEKTAQFVATAAYGRSPVSQKSRYLLFLSKDPAQRTQETKPYQIAVDVSTKMPSVPLIHYKKALSANPSSTIHAQMNFGENAESGGEIKIKGELEQTEERRQYIEEHPLSQLCEQQMQQGNNILPACRNATASANLLDHYSFIVDFKKVPDVFKNVTYKAYSVIRHVAYPYITENIVNPENPNGRIELDVNFAPDLKSVNASLDTPTLSARWTNVRVGPIGRSVAVTHPEYDAVDRVGQWAMLGQQYPTCVVDKTYATTFDNKTYPIDFGKCWHVLLQSTPRPHYDSSSSSSSSDDYESVSILVRDVESHQREVMLILGEEVVTLEAASGVAADYFIVNGQKYRVAKDSMGHYEDKRGNTLVQAYKLPSGALRVYTPEHGFELIYDGLRVKLQAPNDYRGDIRGICGTFDGNKLTDFTTPANCILKNPLEFASIYAIVDGSCQGSAKDLRHHAQNAPCFRQTVMLGDVISDQDAGRYNSTRKNSTKSANMQKSRNGESCTSYRVKVLEEDGKVCFSLKPQPTCTSQCEPTKKIEQKIDFHCIEDTRAARHWVEMIKKGANPDFKNKGANHRATIKLPQSCVPNQ